jgi:hypothetical protein
MTSTAANSGPAPIRAVDTPDNAPPAAPESLLEENEEALRCEECGYRLDGLPAEGRCPECGTPIDQSLAASRRTTTAWDEAPGWGSYRQTAMRIIRRPQRFFRTLQTRVGSIEDRRSALFARLSFLLCAMGAATAIVLHDGAFGMPWAQWITSTLFDAIGSLASPVSWVLYTGVAYAGIVLINRAASFLTAFEAKLRGMRLPAAVVRRGMDYHSVSAVPVVLVIVALTALARYLMTAHTVWMYMSGGFEVYLIVLCATCVLGAVYLFWTYWIGMRNMLYANL